jgi:hypothetical protein
VEAVQNHIGFRVNASGYRYKFKGKFRNVSDNTPDSAAWDWGILGLGVGSQVERSCTIWSNGVSREQEREDQVSSHATPCL